MHITDLLITGYDGDQPVLAVYLAPETATIALTGKDEHGESAVRFAWTRTSHAFTAVVRQLLEDLAAAEPVV